MAREDLVVRPIPGQRTPGARGGATTVPGPVTSTGTIQRPSAGGDTGGGNTGGDAGGSGGDGGGETPPPPPTQLQQNAQDLVRQTQDMWGTIDQSFAQGLQGQLRDVDLQTSVNARRANELNALTGGSAMGGGQAAGQAQAQLGGMALRNNAMVDSQKRQAQARMGYLQMMMDRAAQAERLAATEEEARKAREMQERLQVLANEGALAVAKADAGV